MIRRIFIMLRTIAADLTYCGQCGQKRGTNEHCGPCNGAMF